jgi:hypothetical protein
MVPREFLAGGIFVVEVDKPHHTAIEGASSDGIRTANNCSGEGKARVVVF